MQSKWIPLTILGLGFLLASPQFLHAYEPDPTTPAGYPRRFNTTGVEFGSNVELGASGSTPGIVIDKDGSKGQFTAQAAAVDDDSNYGWGLLGFLGLLGLAGVRSRKPT
jgi:hypothetical protein